MASEIRVNRLSNRSGLSTITFANGGVQFSGITTFANGDFRVGTGATILNPTANEMQFHTAGSTRLTINNSGANLGTGSLTAVDATFSGNVSIGKTLTYEDVKNVDSVGVVTARTGVKITGGDFTVGTAITASSVTGNVTQDVGITTYSGSAVWFKGATANKDMYWSHSSGATVYKDNAQILMGDSSDLQISHDGSNSLIKDTGTGFLSVQGSEVHIRGSNDENGIKVITNDRVEIYHDNSKKFETTSSGIDVTGTAVADALNVTGTSVVATVKSTNNNYVMQMQGNNATDKVYFGTTSGNDFIIANTSSVTERLRITSTGMIGVGVADPAVAGGYHGMEIGGSSNTGLRLSCTASSGWAFTDYEANGTQKFMAGMKGSTDADVCSWRIVTGASLDSNVKFAVTENGKFGFGTASPSYPIHLAGEGMAIDRNAGDPYIALRTSDDTKVSIYGGASTGFRVFTKPSGGSLTERLRITSDGQVQIGGDSGVTGSWSQTHWNLEVYDSTGDAYALLAGTTGAALELRDTVSSEAVVLAANGGCNLYSYKAGNDIAFHNKPSGGSITERLRIASDGTIYGPGGGRKNWFDNGSFDCREGRRANTSMDYGNHHAYGWVTDRFMSRNSVQWSRSTNVPTGKGFHSSTYTNGAGGQIMQAVELPDYGDMGVFEPSSYWCVSFWSTAACNQGGQAFSYDLGSTKTTIPIVHPSSGSAYQTTGETASGTSTGTFSRYYMVFQMPSSIISGATAAYWIWGFSAQGYTTGFQLERVPTSTSKPTPYEHVHPAVTTARCRRYCWQFKNARLVGGYKRNDGQCSWQMQHPVPGTHMPSGSNQSADPYSIHLHDAGIFTNFQSSLQNPGVTSASRYEYDFRSGYFVMSAQSSWSSTHSFIPSWESAEFEVMHGFF